MFKGHPVQKLKNLWIAVFVIVIFVVFAWFDKGLVRGELKELNEQFRSHREELKNVRANQIRHDQNHRELEKLQKHHIEQQKELEKSKVLPAPLQTVTPVPIHSLMTEIKAELKTMRANQLRHDQNHIELERLQKQHVEQHVEQQKEPASPAPPATLPGHPLAMEIKDGMQHAFQAYMRDAWKSDEYLPVSKRGVNTFGGKGLTIIDSLDTLYLMGLDDEYDAAKKFVETDFKFNGRINVFENNIRVLGGLLSAYTLTDEQVFLTKAKEVGEVLLGAFQHRIPCGIIDTNGYCGSQSWAGGKSINAEVGTLSLEFETLSRLTGDKRWSDKIKGINQYWESHHSGLLQMYIDPNSEQMSGPRTIGGGIDSTYEYLIKLKLMNGDPLAAKLYDAFEKEIVENMVVTHGTRTFAKASGSNRLEHLGCFGGGMLILGQRYMKEGLAFTETCAEMYTTTASGIACDSVDITPAGDIVCKSDLYLLRPEVVESIFYAWRATHDPKWRDYAEKIWKALQKHCEVESGGFTDVKYVTRTTPEKMDKQESWFLAETLKYLWLIFQPDSVVSLDEYVFNTECHPLKIV